MHKYRLVAKKGEGTFSEVLKAQSIKNGKYVAIKCMKNHFDSLDQVNNLREIQALRRLSPHANIIKLLEVLYDQPTGRLALVFELMDMNIYELIRGRRHYVAEDRIRNYMYQLMRSMDHMHRNGIFHRDIKPENILIMDDCLKLADFGSCRGIYSKQPYTEYISTRWYRAPECLLTDGYYNYKMDMWGVGCVFFEIVSLFPLFPGTNELDQIQKIHSILGTPPPELLAKMKKRSAHMDFNFPPKEGTGITKLVPHVSPECVDLIIKLLAYNPDDRLSARQALRHPYFRDLRDAEKKQKAMQAAPEMPLSSSGHLPHPGASNTASNSGQQQQQLQAQQQQQRHQQGSPEGSEQNHTIGVTPREPSLTSHQKVEGLGVGSLPSIGPSKGTAQQQQQQHHGPHHSHSHSHSHVAQLLQQQQLGVAAGSSTTAMAAAAAAAAAAEGGAAGTLRGYEPHAEDALSVESGYGGGAGMLVGGGMGVHRLPGMHGHTNSTVGADGQSDADSTGGLPPIGNLSLGKANMVGNQTQRRGLMPASGIYGGHDGAAGGAAASGFGKQGAAKAGGGGGGTTKRQQQLAGAKYGATVPSNNSKVVNGLVVGQTTTLASLKLGATQAGQDQGGGAGMGGGTYKFKANNAGSKGGSKYISPYSLRHLAGGAAGMGAPGT